MKKTITVTAALIGAAILSGPASAFTDKQSEDILHGNGAVQPSRGEPYIHTFAGPKETEGYLLWNLRETKGVGSIDAYVFTGNDRDNRDDLIDNI
ncbi:MAG: hypothetical protein H6963_03905 [Chromatiaceae bacterium]|nr:hypothetical protein [Chromatiaceae bacterium]MCP5408424.1 hypothetical protein [Chromatiaceae bacterium]MCP5444926.1 hypothetical protein [Chromatiaceae bacterium]